MEVLESTELLTTKAVASELGIHVTGLRDLTKKHPELRPAQSPLWTSLEALTAKMQLDADRRQQSVPYRLAMDAGAVLRGLSGLHGREQFLSSEQVCSILAISRDTLYQFTTSRAQQRFGCRLRALRLKGQVGVFYRLVDVYRFVSLLRVLYGPVEIEAPAVSEPASSETPAPDTPTFSTEQFHEILK